MRNVSILVLACLMLSPTIASSQSRRRSVPKRSAPATKAIEKSSSEIRAASEQVLSQIKALTRFLYLLGGIVKGIESSDQATRNNEASSVAIEQNERNKTKVRESLRNVRMALEKIEADFRSNPTLRKYYSHIAGVARIGEAAENQAAANRFDEAGRSLLKAVDQLAEALAAMR